MDISRSSRRHGCFQAWLYVRSSPHGTKSNATCRWTSCLDGRHWQISTSTYRWASGWRALIIGIRVNAYLQVWQLVNEANEMYWFGARVARSRILFTDPGLPMQRSGKGTVQRGPTLQLYKSKLDQLYEREGDTVLGNELVLPWSSLVWFSPYILSAKSITRARKPISWYWGRLTGTWEDCLASSFYSGYSDFVEAMLLSLTSLVIFSHVRPIGLSAAIFSSIYRWLFRIKFPVKGWTELCLFLIRCATSSVVRWVISVTSTRRSCEASKLVIVPFVRVSERSMKRKQAFAQEW